MCAGQVTPAPFRNASGTGAGSRRSPVMTRAQGSVLVLLGLLLLLLWLVPEVPLLGFAAVLLAVALHAGGDPLARRTGLPEWAAVLLVATLALVVLGLAAWAAAGPLAQQATELAESLPKSLETLRGQIAGTAWGDWLLRQAEPGRLIGSGGAEGAAAAAAQAAGSTLGGLGNLVLVLLLALYMAVQPTGYLSGLRSLFDPRIGRRGGQKAARGRGNTRRLRRGVTVPHLGGGGHP